MAQARVFARITKVDEAKQLVYGRATQEVVDKSGEILDYDRSKPYFEAWSKSFAEATDGKSFGNIRAMHGKVAAGKIAEPVSFNDAEKAIDIVARVTDTNEWPKCLDGTYTGFSIGGKYIDRKAEKVDGADVVRFVADPTEISLVDNPCVPTAQFFDVIKADGVVQKVEFKVKAVEPEPLTVTGTDDEVAEFAKAMNDAGLSMADAIVLVKAKGEKAADPPADTIEKCIEDFAALLKRVEATAAPAALAAELAAPLSVQRMVDLAKQYDTPFTLDGLWPQNLLAKASKTDGHLQKMHDMLGDMGAKCTKDAAAAAPLAKVDEPNVELTTVKAELAKAQADIAALKAQPMPHFVTLKMAAAAAKPITKEQDTAPAAASGTGPSLAPEQVELTKDDYILNPLTGDVDFETSRVVKAHKLKLAAAQ